MSKPSTYIRLASGSFGSRNGQPWSQELAKANARTQPSDLAAGTFGSVDRIEPHIVQRAIEAQMCPWCGAGPYKVVAAHTNRAHGIDRSELRILAGLPQNSSICDPSYSDERRSGWMQRPDREAVTRKASEASVRAGAYRKASAASVSAGAYRNAATTRAKLMAVRNRERDAAIVQAVDAGEFREDVAKLFGVAPTTVSRIIRKHAQPTDEVDGRKHAAKRRWDASTQEALRHGWARASEEIRTARLRRFEELGGTWEALDAMASEENTTRRKMAAILRHAGAAVPDGRTVSPHRRKRGTTSLPPCP